ncbi:MAG: long-chain fatty acid--CoA ligase [Gemmatimonadota bacterium]|nr:long-chain fatty acid--CoA ligase [Gemmatimonadota bacterium]
MTTLRAYANPAPVPTGTLVELFLEACDSFPARPAFQYFDGDVLRDVGHPEAYDTVRSVAASLRARGVGRGDRVALLSENRPEWALADYACLCVGAQDVPIYSTLLPEHVAYILRDSGAKAVFVSTTEQLDKVTSVRAECPDLQTVVIFDPPQSLPAGVQAWKDFVAAGGDGGTDDAFREEALSARPEDVATLIYTSGTTGEPKGVMLTHGNLYTNVQASQVALRVGERETTLSFLPLSHVFQRMVDYLLFWRGCVIAYAHSIQTVAQDIKVVRPTLVVSVPRLYEKIYNRLTDASGLKGALVRWAMGVGGRWSDATLAGEAPGAFLKAQYGLADRLVFTKVRDAMGGRLRFFVSGGAPLTPEIARFFHYAGLPILEGYGLTETSPVTNVNTLADLRIGTVGRPIPSTEIRIADDGEILVRGPQIMKGYFKKPDATAEVIDAEGWFRTGDIGEIDADGFLKITDRKKDIIVTAGGKNIAPQPIENRLKTNAFVEQVVMIGDRRKFPVLLIVPDFAVLETWAKGQGIGTGDRRALVAEPRIQTKILSEVEGELAHLASYERPKKIGLLHEEFSLEQGTMTPKQSIRRREVEKLYRDLIDGFYASDAVERDVFAAP